MTMAVLYLLVGVSSAIIYVAFGGQVLATPIVASAAVAVASLVPYLRR
jgi:hypothetical protein